MPSPLPPQSPPSAVAGCRKKRTNAKQKGKKRNETPPPDCSGNGTPHTGQSSHFSLRRTAGTAMAAGTASIAGEESVVAGPEERCAWRRKRSASI